jgi:hypothetical protein
MRRIVWVLTLALLSAGALAAQQDTLPPRPFVPGGVYDRPYLTTLLGRTALGGYAEAHARFERADGVTEELGFEAKRFNLFTATRVSDFVRIGAELEIEEAGEEVKLEYAAIDVLMHRAATLRAGMILSPLGRFNLAHDSPRNEFTDRPLVSTEILGVALSEPGVGLLGLFPVGPAARVTYEAYAVNGFGDGLLRDVGDGIRLPMGRQGGEDANHSPSVVARVAASPREGWEIGVSAHHGAYNTFESEGVALAQRRDLTIAVVDFEIDLSSVRLQGEGARARIDLPPSLEGLFAGQQSGFYVEATGDFARGLVATMPASYLTWKARLDAIDLDSGLPGDSREQISLGVNFRPTRDTALKLDYVRGRSHDRFNNRTEHAAVLFSIATYF